jgi:hypothetical protein
MNEKERAYKLLYKLAEENDYVIVHSRFISWQKKTTM